MQRTDTAVRMGVHGDIMTTCLLNIFDDMFSDCSGLTSITFADGLKSICQNAFKGEYKGVIAS